MSLFRRKPKDEPEVDELDLEDEVEETEEEIDEEEEARERALREAVRADAKRRETGPFDRSEVDDLGERIDIGGLLLPAAPMQLNFDVDQNTQNVRSVSILRDGSSFQLSVFAAPRTEGIWWEVRPILATEIQRQGGTAEEHDGVFGRELLARMPVQADGRTGTQVSRFFGIDGPRWFLRGVVTGPAAADPQVAEPLEDLVRQIVVVRGTEAMAPRDAIALKLPAGARKLNEPAEDTGTDEVPDAQPTSEDFNPFERGPEIQEVR